MWSLLPTPAATIPMPTSASPAPASRPASRPASPAPVRPRAHQSASPGPASSAAETKSSRRRARRVPDAQTTAASKTPGGSHARRTAVAMGPAARTAPLAASRRQFHATSGSPPPLRASALGRTRGQGRRRPGPPRRGQTPGGQAPRRHGEGGDGPPVPGGQRGGGTPVVEALAQPSAQVGTGRMGGQCARFVADPPPAGVQSPHEIHVLAESEGLVEPAEFLERGSPDGEDRARNVGHRATWPDRTGIGAHVQESEPSRSGPA